MHPSNRSTVRFMPNRLANETSPYLLQHKDNPVDWYPWGDEAFSAAQEANRPILLSVGYSTCHWCHVMERESFEDDDTATLMNEHFVSIKVDREERPDVDAIYMDAVNAITGRGGWPMTVFLTPTGEPFYAGTYFPNDDRHGMPSFQRVLGSIHDAWTNRNEEVTEQASQLTQSIGRVLPAADSLPDGTALVNAIHSLGQHFDAEHGGMGAAPKFPQEPVLEFLARTHDVPWASASRSMFVTTLEKMAAGGIYDHLGGGFSRYAVDRIWLVPHFEKMLYNNADLARLYVRGWQITGNDRFRTVAYETLDYILNDMTDPTGGFYAAEDADSEGVEGKFYVFTSAEFHQVVDSQAAPVAAAYFGVTASGNFEGDNVLHEARTVTSVAADFDLTVEKTNAHIALAKQQLLEHRNARVRPGLDSKVIAAWNGLATRAFAVAGAVFDEQRFLEAARTNARFVLSEMRMPDGRLHRTWSDGRASISGFLEDHAAYALGLIELYQATGETEWFTAGRDLVDLLNTHFGGSEGVLFASAADASHLVVRPTDQQDNPSASGASLAAEAYLLMALLTGESSYLDQHERIVKAGATLIERAPSAAGHLLAVHATARRRYREIALVGPKALEWSRRLAGEYRPNVIVAASVEPESAVPLLAGRHQGLQTMAYVCEQMVCQRPVDTYAALVELL